MVVPPPKSMPLAWTSSAGCFAWHSAPWQGFDGANQRAMYSFQAADSWGSVCTAR